jgi:DeoR/GlpR family transcriptional regulator of sugar metabolism
MLVDTVGVLATQRQDRILAETRLHGAVKVADLVEALDVSDMTIRRDITELARAGLVRRVHGGAVAVDADRRSAVEPGFETKRTWAAAEKAAIAQEALRLVEPGRSIALSAGTTTHLLAQLLAAAGTLRPLTVVTNSLPVAAALHHAPAVPGAGELEVILTGGIRTPSDALVGPVADAALASLRVDHAFLGVHGLDADGATTPNVLEAATDRALMRCAARVTVLADHSKWGVVGLARIAPLDEVDALVSDTGLTHEARTVLERAVPHVRLVAPDADPSSTPHPSSIPDPSSTPLPQEQP